MQHDTVVLYFIGGLYAFLAWLILYQIEIRFHFYANLKCRLGYHKRTKRELGKVSHTYRCVNCNKPKDHPHLRIIDGGKKDLGVKFRF